MRSASIYMSNLIRNTIWPSFSVNLKSKRAKDNYFSVMCMICDYTKRDFLDITHAQAQKYFDSLLVFNTNKKRLALSTIQSRLSMLCSMAAHIEDNRELFNIDDFYTNIYIHINIPETSDYLKPDDIPSLDELNAILDASSDDPMMYLIFAMVIKCGLAAGEICKIKKEHIVEDKKGRFCVEIHEKTKTRYVKLPEDVVSIFLDYMKPSGDYLFYNKKGLNLKVRNLEAYVRKYVSEAGVLKKYTIQDVRNAAICYLKASGADDMAVAEYVGVEGRWMYRYDKVLEELDMQAVDFSRIRIINKSKEDTR